MADAQVSNELGVVDKRFVQGDSATRHSGTTSTNTKDVTALKARLTAISATSYTPARLATMTVNDMIYALRLNDEAASI